MIQYLWQKHREKNFKLVEFDQFLFFYCGWVFTKIFSIFSVIFPRSGYLYMQGVKKALQKYNSKEEKEWKLY